MFEKITPEEIQGVQVQSAPDKLPGPANVNKSYFDKLPLLIVDKYNSLIVLLEGGDGASNIGAIARFAGDGTNIAEQLNKSVVYRSDDVKFIRLRDKTLVASVSLRA